MSVAIAATRRLVCARGLLNVIQIGDAATRRCSWRASRAMRPPSARGVSTSASSSDDQHTVAAASTSATPSPLPAPSSPPGARVLVFGGGAMGLLHAALLQLRAEHDARATAATVATQAVSSAHSTSPGLFAASSVSSSSGASVGVASAPVAGVHVVSSQADLIDLLRAQGCHADLLRSFANDHAEWLQEGAAQPWSTQPVITAAAASDLSPSWLPPPPATHLRLSRPVRISASRSAFPSLAHSVSTSYTHVLVCTKGEAAFQHAAEELLHLFRHQQSFGPTMTAGTGAKASSQIGNVAAADCSSTVSSTQARLQLPSLSSPVVCLLLNGVGHAERMLEHMDALLRAEAEAAGGKNVTDADSGADVTKSGPAPLSAPQRAAFLRHFRRHLVLATTTSGARLLRHSDPATHALAALQLLHGGVGVTNVMQNEWEYHEEQVQGQDQTMHPTRPQPSQLHSSADPPAPLPTASPSARMGALFRRIGLPTVVVPFPQSASSLHTKLLINCVINPLTALHSVRNGELLQPQFRGAVRGLAGEAVVVLRAMGVTLAEVDEAQIDPEAMQATRDALAEVEDEAEEVDAGSEAEADAPGAVATAAAGANASQPPLPTGAHDPDGQLRLALLHVYQTAARTSPNYSSMYTDLHPQAKAADGRTAHAGLLSADGPAGTVRASPSPPRAVRTEADAITGYLLRQAAAHGLDPRSVRRHRGILRRIRRREEQINAQREREFSERTQPSA